MDWLEYRRQIQWHVRTGDTIAPVARDSQEDRIIGKRLTKRQTRNRIRAFVWISSLRSWQGQDSRQEQSAKCKGNKGWVTLLFFPLMSPSPVSCFHAVDIDLLSIVSHTTSISSQNDMQKLLLFILSFLSLPNKKKESQRFREGMTGRKESSCIFLSSMLRLDFLSPFRYKTWSSKDVKEKVMKDEDEKEEVRGRKREEPKKLKEKTVLHWQASYKWFGGTLALQGKRLPRVFLMPD